MTNKDELEYFHFDSINSIYNTDCYDTTFYLNNSIRNINRIYLKSLEMGIGFNNIRVNNGSSVLTLIINDISYTNTISDKAFSSVNELCAALNTAFTACPIRPTFTASSITQKNNNYTCIIYIYNCCRWSFSTIYSGFYIRTNKYGYLNCINKQF